VITLLGLVRAPRRASSSEADVEPDPDWIIGGIEYDENRLDPP